MRRHSPRHIRLHRRLVHRVFQPVVRASLVGLDVLQLPKHAQPHCAAWQNPVDKRDVQGAAGGVCGAGKHESYRPGPMRALGDWGRSVAHVASLRHRIHSTPTNPTQPTRLAATALTRASSARSAAAGYDEPQWCDLDGVPTTNGPEGKHTSSAYPIAACTQSPCIRSLASAWFWRVVRLSDLRASAARAAHHHHHTRH